MLFNINRHNITNFQTGDPSIEYYTEGPTQLQTLSFDSIQRIQNIICAILESNHQLLLMCSSIDRLTFCSNVNRLLFKQSFGIKTFNHI